LSPAKPCWANFVEEPRATRDAALDLALTIPLLPAAPQIAGIVQAYVRHKVMPEDPTGDALHLAFASFHAGDFLVTWNCRHLANANKFGHIRDINRRLGLASPDLITPLELLGES